MSITNHYKICKDCTTEEICELHVPTRYWNPSYNHKPERAIGGRRNWERKTRWPRYGRGSWHNPPPRWWWRIHHKKARAAYRQMMLQEDPVLPRERDLIDLWNWY